MIAATAKPAHWKGFGGSLKPALAAAAAPRPARLPTPPALMYARRRVPPRCRRGSPLRTEATAHLTLVPGLRQALRPSLTSSLGGGIACLGRRRCRVLRVGRTAARYSNASTSGLPRATCPCQLTSHDASSSLVARSSHRVGSGRVLDESRTPPRWTSDHTVSWRQAP